MKEGEAWTTDVGEHPQVGHHHQMSKDEGMRGHKMGRHAYAMFALNTLLGLVMMYVVMFTMIDTRADFRDNLNMLYMAVTMAAPMGIIMMLSMRGVYPNKRLNLALHAVFIDRDQADPGVCRRGEINLVCALRQQGGAAGECHRGGDRSK